MITIGRGLSKAGNVNVSPRPAVRTGQLAQTVNAGGWSDQFALIALISRTFLLRAPSECLPVARRGAGGDLSSEDRKSCDRNCQQKADHKAQDKETDGGGVQTN